MTLRGATAAVAIVIAVARTLRIDLRDERYFGRAAHGAQDIVHGVLPLRFAV